MNHNENDSADPAQENGNGHYQELESIILVDRGFLRKLYAEKGFKNRREFFDEVARVVEKIKGKPVKYAEGYLNDLMAGRKNFLLSEVIGCSRVLDIPVSELLSEKEEDFFSGTEINTYGLLKKFDGESAYNDYLYNMESKGRYLIFRKFPSSAYSSRLKHKRNDQILKNFNIFSIEFYRLRSVIAFAFSKVAPTSIQERIDILKKIIDVFNEYNIVRQLYFYEIREEGTTLTKGFSSATIVQNGSIILLDTPLPGYTVLELKNKKMAGEILSEFNKRNNARMVIVKEEDALEVMNILRIILEEKLNGKIKEQNEIMRFYEECSARLPDISSFICEQLSPDLRDRIEP